MNKLLQSVCILVLLPAIIAGQEAIHYEIARPGYKYTFPHDHGSHSEFKIEWWYYTGNLRATDGQEFGYELTFFRTGMDRLYENPSAWRVRDLYLAHFAVTDVRDKKFYYFEKSNRAGPGIAGAAAGTLDVWNENWFARLDGETLKLRASAGDVSIDLSLDATKDPAIHGTDGLSQKAEGAGHASHYYSLTRMSTLGAMRVGKKTLRVAGESWMDHEFGTNQLGENQAGWDWMGIQLDNGTDLMLYRMRNRNGTLDPYSSGTIVEFNSKTEHLRLQDFVAIPGREWKSPTTGVSYPIEWTVNIPGQDASLRVVAVVDDQELVTTRSTGIAYWEGAIQVSGTWQGKNVRGRGYLELTGYSEQYRPRV